MKTYQNGPFKVSIAEDGAIKVKQGDWLSKYSAAIYNDFIHFYEYGRKRRDGRIEIISNFSSIYAGEIIYHIPTFEAWQKKSIKGPSGGKTAVLPHRQLSPVEKKKAIEI